MLIEIAVVSHICNMNPKRTPGILLREVMSGKLCSNHIDIVEPSQLAGLSGRIPLPIGATETAA